LSWWLRWRWRVRRWRETVGVWLAGFLWRSAVATSALWLMNWLWRWIVFYRAWLLILWVVLPWWLALTATLVVWTRMAHAAGVRP
jgi:hypothetical protein